MNIEIKEGDYITLKDERPHGQMFWPVTAVDGDNITVAIVSDDTAFVFSEVPAAEKVDKHLTAREIKHIGLVSSKNLDDLEKIFKVYGKEKGERNDNYKSR